MYIAQKEQPILRYSSKFNNFEVNLTSAYAIYDVIVVKNFIDHKIIHPKSNSKYKSKYSKYRHPGSFVTGASKGIPYWGGEFERLERKGWGGG